jgi:hypothetical protein
MCGGIVDAMDLKSIFYEYTGSSPSQIINMIKLVING